MLCFSCESAWHRFVHIDYGKVVRILLTDRTCTEIWARCEKFGELTRVLKHVMLDSRLATMQSTALENFNMFADQQGLCDWMHNAVAMHPFTTPSEIQREAAPIPDIIRAERRLWNASSSLNSSHLRQLTGAHEVEPETLGYDAMDVGKSSGFDITWGGITSRTRMAALCSVSHSLLAMMTALRILS
mmetsp:Transcript_58494/g.107663  ORF Transcript_58494/g.107663 Transcript_58494/m.107663 type:complete len:187 (+) Transcript_58494:85-645(+)